MIGPSPSVDFIQHPLVYVERQIEIGKRLIIVAESEKGQYYEPSLVYNKDMVVDTFKSGPIIQCYEDAISMDEDLCVFLMRIEPNRYDIAFTVLESFDFDLLYLDEVHFDRHHDLIDSYIEFAKIKEDKGNLIHCILSLSSKSSFVDIESLFKRISDLTVELSGDELEETGKYLSLVVNQMSLKKAGAVYAGILASINPEVSPINKTIPNINLEIEFTKEQILKLREVGIVCFKNTFQKGVVCTSSGCAVSTAGSVHKHISNFRIAQEIINEIARRLEIFIGKPNVVFQASNIEDIIEALCLRRIIDKKVREYDYSIKINELYGIIEINIEVVPIFSIHKITGHSVVRVYK